MNRGKLCGCVLAGGLSSRMGMDKATLRPFGAAGPSMLELAYGVLQKLCGYCFISAAHNAGGAPENPSSAPIPCVFDRHPGRGPISGILAALEETEKTGFAGALVLACDMPLMRAEILEYLLQQSTAGKAGCFFRNVSSGKVEMLAGIYFPAAVPRLQTAMEAGKYGLFAALPAAALRLVPLPGAWERYFSNCNTPAEMENVKKLASASGRNRKPCRFPRIL